eukprot:16566_1
MTNSPIQYTATYNLLTGMGFPARISLTASKLYLNDIEEAVNYCSELSSTDSSPIHSSMLRQGENYKKCHDLLLVSYPQYLSLFERWYREDEFEDAQLMEEFVENCDFEESFFIQYVEEHVEGIPFNDLVAMQLFTHLSDILKYEPSVHPIPSKSKSIHHVLMMDGYIRQIKHQLNNQYPLFAHIPFTIYLLCDRYVPKFCGDLISVDASCTDTHLIDHAKQSYYDNCKTLFPDPFSLDDTFFQLCLIGQHNSMPLLTYLTDAYNRHRISNRVAQFKKLERRFQDKQRFSLSLRKWRSKHNLIDVTIEQFIRKRCKAFRGAHWFQDMCIRSMHSLMNISALGRPVLESRSIYRIDDDWMQIADCMLDSCLFVDSYLNARPLDPMPLQFDVMIIPKCVIDEDEECVEDNDLDIETLLQNANCEYSKKILRSNDERSRTMTTLTTQLNRKSTNRRCCVFVDRRQPREQMVVYQMKDETDNEYYVNESLFDNSLRCLVPGLCGAKHDYVDKMLTLSFHVISRYETRMYLYLNGCATRFYVQDLMRYLPYFFKINNGQFKPNIDFKNKLAKCEQILSDTKFDEFYKSILGK